MTWKSSDENILHALWLQRCFTNLRHKPPEKGFSLICPRYAVVLVVLNRALWRISMSLFLVFDFQWYVPIVAGGFLWGTKSWTRPNWRSFSFWTWPLFIVMWGRIGGYNTPSPSEKNGCRCAGRDWACSGSTASPSPSCTSCGPGPACKPT